MILKEMEERAVLRIMFEDNEEEVELKVKNQPEIEVQCRLTAATPTELKLNSWTKLDENWLIYMY